MYTKSQLRKRSCTKECSLILDLLPNAGKADTVLHLILKTNGISFSKKMFSYIYLIIHLKPVSVYGVTYLLASKDPGYLRKQSLAYDFCTVV